MTGSTASPRGEATDPYRDRRDLARMLRPELGGCSRRRWRHPRLALHRLLGLGATDYPRAMPTDPGVDAWFATSAHPMKPVMQRVREVILAADPRISETMKWKSPTFMFGGNLASIDPHAKRWVSVLFHRGAEIPGDHPILEGEGRLARYARFDDIAGVDAKRLELEGVVRAWCDSRA